MNRVLYILIITFLGLLMYHFASAAQDDTFYSNESEGTQNAEFIILPSKAESSVDLRGFPNEVELTFALSQNGRFFREGEFIHSALRLYEDGRKVEIDQLDPITRPMSFVFILDIDSDVGMISPSDFIQFVKIAGETGTANDSWLFCSTNWEQICTSPLRAKISEWSDEQIIGEIYIHLAGDASVPAHSDLSVSLRRALALDNGSSERKVIIIVKNRVAADTPYIADNLITALLLNRTPVVLINWSDIGGTADAPGFVREAIAQLEGINGCYLDRGRVKYWNQNPGGLKGCVVSGRRTDFRATYHSHLFRDDRLHQILLSYETDEVRAWEQGEFRFLPLDTDDAGRQLGSLSPLVAYEGLVELLLLIMLLGVMVIVADE